MAEPRGTDNMDISASGGRISIGQCPLLTGRGAILAAAVLTLIVLAESIFPPWAPYFIIYAVLAIAIPVALRTYAFGGFGQVVKRHWKLIAGVLVMSLIWDLGVTGWLYERGLTLAGLGSNPFYSLTHAVDALCAKAAVRFGISKENAMMIYAAYIVLWAPLGEELFYRGYLQGVLRKSRGFPAAAVISAAFFGIRHATHLFFLWPHVPLVAAASWVVSTFVFGLLMSCLYEKTQSLYPPMLVHLLVNLAELMAG